MDGRFLDVGQDAAMDDLREVGYLSVKLGTGIVILESSGFFAHF